jgi:hypothetical protein
VRRTAVVAFLSVIVTAALVPAALADTLCDYNYGPYCCNQTAFLRLVMTYKSQWHSEKPVSSQGANPYWHYTNTVDALRQTAQQRGGSSSASWEMWEWALGSC